VARTLNPEAHAVRRDAFLDSAQRLIQVKGYEQTSVQDVLDDLDTSKGAFYHYFGSKSALLDGVVERMVEAAIVATGPIVADPDLPADTKLREIFAATAAFKSARKEFLLALIEVWLSDDNAVVRERFRRSVVHRLTPVIAAIIRQGRAEGVFTTSSSPEDAARVFVSLVLGANTTATELFLARQAGSIAFDDVRRALDAYAEAFERILGAKPGSLPLVDEAVLHEWFDQEGVN
jgi:AcrR family transcriptional regulator